MQKSTRKRLRREKETESLINERAYGGNRKPLDRQPSSPPRAKKGVTLGTLQQIWPSVNNWRSSLG